MAEAAATKTTSNTVRVRRCDSPTDADAIHKLVKQLAEFEKEADSVLLTPDDIRRDGFESDPPLFFAALAEQEGEAVGLLLCYFKYSTWEGKCLHVEDLYVIPEQRRCGIGQMLFDHAVAEARNSNCARLELNVLDWNTPAIRFYESKGAHSPNNGSWVLLRWNKVDLDKL